MRVRTTMAVTAIAALGALGVTTGLVITERSSSSELARPVVAAPAAVPAAVPPVLPVTAPLAAAPTTTTSATPTTTRTTPTTTRTTSSRPTTTTATRARASSGIPCSITGDGACVSLSREKAWLVRDGEVVLSATMSSGRKGERTPTGSFSVTRKNADHVSSIYGSEMPWAVFFNGGIAFHAGDTSSGSAGCIRLSNSAAKQFFQGLSVGDRVVVVK